MPTIQHIGALKFTKGRMGYRPIAIVVHIMDGFLSGTDAWFNDPRCPASAHYGIGKTGEIHQYVDEADTAWHAGSISKPNWTLLKRDNQGNSINPNRYTIGVEHEGKSGEVWTDATYQSSAWLIKDIANRWVIPIDRDHIVGHYQIDLDRRSGCPGKGIDFDKLINLARQLAGQPASYNLINLSGSATVSRNVNIRSQAPSTTAQVVKMVTANTTLSFVGFTSNGENVQGNAHWYKMADGNFFWAGATDKPIPSL